MRRFVVRTRVLGVALGALICGVAIVGCGSGEKVPPLFPVSGKVTYNGKPLPEATVMFFPDGGPNSAAKKSKKGEPEPMMVPIIGETDADGNFELSWGVHEGVPEGKYKVGISAVEPLKEGGDTEDRRPNKIPDKFGNPTISGLTAVVKDGDNENVNFTLVDE